jgi:hypothetical protein
MGEKSIYSNLMQDKLSHCLSSRLLRRWCMFEWFYSAIDYPWFAKSEFVEYLNHVKLGHVPRLTHVEWGVIRRFVIFKYFVRFSCICPPKCNVFAVLLESPVDCRSSFCTRRERSLRSIVIQSGSIILNFYLALEKVYQPILRDL